MSSAESSPPAGAGQTLPSPGDYVVRGRRSIASVPGLRVRQLDLASGQCVPWHLHTNITDTFVCLSGPMEVQTRSPEARHVLQPGDMLAIPPGQAHYVQGVDSGECRFLIVQGVGEYDYVPV